MIYTQTSANKFMISCHFEREKVTINSYCVNNCLFLSMIFKTRNNTSERKNDKTCGVYKEAWRKLGIEKKVQKILKSRMVINVRRLQKLVLFCIAGFVAISLFVGSVDLSAYFLKSNVSLFFPLLYNLLT